MGTDLSRSEPAHASVRTLPQCKDIVVRSAAIKGSQMRLAVGGFLHESHSFAPRPTTYDEFVHPGGFPGLQHGAGLIAAMRDTAMPIAGAIAEAEEAGASLVPLAWAIANPAGPVETEAFERIAALICAELSLALAAGRAGGGEG